MKLIKGCMGCINEYTRKNLSNRHEENDIRRLIYSSNNARIISPRCSVHRESYPHKQPEERQGTLRGSAYSITISYSKSQTLRVQQFSSLIPNTSFHPTQYRAPVICNQLPFSPLLSFFITI